MYSKRTRGTPSALYYPREHGCANAEHHEPPNELHIPPGAFPPRLSLFRRGAPVDNEQHDDQREDVEEIIEEQIKCSLSAVLPNSPTSERNL